MPGVVEAGEGHADGDRGQPVGRERLGHLALDVPQGRGQVASAIEVDVQVQVLALPPPRGLRDPGVAEGRALRHPLDRPRGDRHLAPLVLGQAEAPAGHVGARDLLVRQVGEYEECAEPGQAGD
ncbi:MAG: hypothetical protein WKF31_11885 [Thermoleophilaceae bacterium]